MLNVKDEILKFFESKLDSTDPDVLETSLREIIDSVEMIEFLAFLEKTFNIVINDDEVSPEVFESIQSVVIFIIEKTDKGV